MTTTTQKRSNELLELVDDDQPTGEAEKKQRTENYEIGDEVDAIDGNGIMYRAAVVDVSDEGVMVKYDGYSEMERFSVEKTHLLFSVTPEDVEESKRVIKNSLGYNKTKKETENRIHKQELELSGMKQLLVKLELSSKEELGDSQKVYILLKHLFRHNDLKSLKIFADSVKINEKTYVDFEDFKNMMKTIDTKHIYIVKPQKMIKFRPFCDSVNTPTLCIYVTGSNKVKWEILRPNDVGFIIDEKCIIDKDMLTNTSSGMPANPDNLPIKIVF
jgi:hypothetical protein